MAGAYCGTTVSETRNSSLLLLLAFWNTFFLKVYLAQPKYSGEGLDSGSNVCAGLC